MENVKPNLFLNYERQIGKPWLRPVVGGLNIINPRFETAYTRRIKEILVPAAGAESGKVLDAISNAIYVDARRHNMSLSAYGHLDPFKFCLSSTFLGLLMIEARRAFAIACHYEFGNLHFGRILMQAAGFKFDSIISNYANLCSRYNKLVSRINNLMVPNLKLFNKWMAHRGTIYKDDEGDRYSLYVYQLANIYELDVNPESTTVGQLLYRDMNTVVTREQLSGGLVDMGAYLDYIESLVAKYESDDDLVNFSTECIKAGMSHLVLAPIPSTAEAFAKVDLDIQYSLDDIMALENAKVVHPVTGSAMGAEFSWNIYEDPITNTFAVGYWKALYSGLTDEKKNVLPCIMPKRLGFGNAMVVTKDTTFNIEDRPIYTHAKIKSEEGLDALTKYIVSLTRPTNPTPWVQKLNTSVIRVSSDEGWKNGQSSIALNDTTYDGGNLELVRNVNIHGTEMIQDIVCFRTPDENLGDDSNFINVNLHYDILCQIQSSATVGEVYNYLKSMIGWKTRITCYSFSSTGYIPMVSDYDYITTVSEDALSNFFIALAWNNAQIA